MDAAGAAATTPSMVHSNLPLSLSTEAATFTTYGVFALVDLRASERWRDGS